MKHTFLLFVLSLLILPGISYAQKASVQGRLADTSSFRPMAFSSISLIRKDSILIQHAFADRNSQFRLDSIQPDTYRLLITRPGYADYEEDLVLSTGQQMDLGSIYLISRENLLREVLVRDRSAIRIMGDTTEFLVDSFLVNKNATVEELLKKLPGIQVDKDGKIKAQGKEVKRVLVDGEEFFGNDPTVATRNLRADNVETVQVFDRASEQTIKTGLDDGAKEKTINLTLKEEAKKGSFGKLGGAYGTKNNSNITGSGSTLGTENRYETEAMANHFKSKRKASVFATAGNTRKSGLDWEDREKYMGGNNVEFDDASGYMYSYYQSDPNEFDGSGIPSSYYAGGYYADKIKNDKLAFNMLATRRQTSVRGIEKDFTQYILPDTMYFVKEVNEINNVRWGNNLNGKSDYQIDSLTRIVVKATWAQSGSNLRSAFSSENLNSLNKRVNLNARTLNTEGENLDWEYSLSLTRKMKKTGRSVSLGWTHKQKSKLGNTYLLSDTYFFKGDSSILSEQKLDQLKKVEENGQSFGTHITYTEPLSKKYSLITNYNFNKTLNRARINTFNQTFTGNYSDRVDSLSNDLDYDIGIHDGGIQFQYRSKKINASLGGRISYTQLTQKQILTDSSSFQNFLNLFPTASFNYKPGNTRSINLSYNGSTRQPNLQQINPIQDLSNPLIIFKGNPNLSQSFTNRISINYNSFKPMSDRSIYLSMDLSQTLHDFSTYDEVDEQGRKVYKTVNVEGNHSMNLYMYHYFKIHALELSVNQNIQSSYSVRSGFINTKANRNESYNVNYSFNMSYEKEELIEAFLGPGINYNESRSSLRPDVVTQFFTYELNSGIELFLPKKMQWEVEATWNIRPQTDVFKSNNNNILVNASVKRKFLKDESLVARIGVQDLLNQNIGFYRNVNSNYINENTFLVMKRYFLVGLTWQFNSNKLSDKP